MHICIDSVLGYVDKYGFMLASLCHCACTAGDLHVALKEWLQSGTVPPADKHILMARLYCRLTAWHSAQHHARQAVAHLATEVYRGQWYYVYGS